MIRLALKQFGKCGCVIPHQCHQYAYLNHIYIVTFPLSLLLGYGHMSPQTWQGQLFCIFYSIVAIPVAGIMLLSVGSHVSLAIRVFIRFMDKTILSGRVWGSAELKSTMVTFVLMILMIIFGAILTSHTDDWSFIEGIYFYFISVSTIGFGDYVVNDGELKSSAHTKTIAVNFTIVLITLGLCVVSSVLCSVSAAIEERQRKLRLRMSNSAVGAVCAANTAFNSVTSNLPSIRSFKFRDMNCNKEENKGNNDQRVELQLTDAGQPENAKPISESRF